MHVHGSLRRVHVAGPWQAQGQGVTGTACSPPVSGRLCSVHIPGGASWRLSPAQLSPRTVWPSDTDPTGPAPHHAPCHSLILCSTAPTAPPLRRLCADRSCAGGARQAARLRRHGRAAGAGAHAGAPGAQRGQARRGGSRSIGMVDEGGCYLEWTALNKYRGCVQKCLTRDARHLEQ